MIVKGIKGQTYGGECEVVNTREKCHIAVDDKYYGTDICGKPAIAEFRPAEKEFYVTFLCFRHWRSIRKWGMGYE